MKIAVFTDTFLPNINGIVTSILNSSKMLAAKGHKVYILTVQPKGDRRKKMVLSKNIQVFYHKSVGLLKYPDFRLVRPDVVRTLVMMKKIKPDVIHIHTPSFLGWTALFVASIFDIPVVGTYHTFLPDFLEYVPLPKINHSKAAKKLTWAYTRRFYNRCNIVTTPSVAMKRELEKHGIKKKVIFISNGVDLGKFRPLKARKNGKTLLHVGRIGYEKNIDVVLKAFRLLLKKRPARLVIAGGGPDLDRLKRHAKRLGISKHVLFLGPVPHDSLPKLYSSADVFVTASTIETEGLVVLEAMACGLPVVAVDALAIPYIVKNGKNGLIARPYDAAEMARNMETLLANNSLREHMGVASVSMAAGFDLKKSVYKLESVYRALASTAMR